MSAFQFFRLECIDHQEARRRYSVFAAGFVLLVSLTFVSRFASTVLRENFGNHLTSLCPFLNITGLPCPFCGLTRSLFSLLEGNLARASLSHPLGPVLWGGIAALGISSFTLMLFKRKVTLVISRRAVIATIVVVTLVAWYSNITYGHH